MEIVAPGCCDTPIAADVASAAGVAAATGAVLAAGDVQPKSIQCFPNGSGFVVGIN